MKKQPLQMRTITADVTALFDPIKDLTESAVEFKLSTLRNLVNHLIENYTEDADITVEISGDDYYTEWTWIVAQQRLETVEEQKARFKREADRAKEEKKRQVQKEKEEKKLYLKLKKKYEKTIKPEDC